MLSEEKSEHDDLVLVAVLKKFVGDVRIVSVEKESPHAFLTTCSVCTEMSNSVKMDLIVRII